MVKHRIVISLDYSHNKVSTVYLHAGSYVCIKSIIKCVFIYHSEEILILWERLLHERPVVLHAVANSVRDRLGSLADQHVVGSWGGAGADTEQRIERGMPCSAPIEAEHELVEVVLEVGPPQSVVNAQAPALEI